MIDNDEIRPSLDEANFLDQPHVLVLDVDAEQADAVAAKIRGIRRRWRHHIESVEVAKSGDRAEVRATCCVGTAEFLYKEIVGALTEIERSHQ